MKQNFKLLTEVLPQRYDSGEFGGELLATAEGRVIGSRKEVSKFVLDTTMKIAASLGIDNSKFTIDVIKDVPKELKKFAEFGFRVIDESAIDTGKTDSYDVVDVFLAHSKTSRPDLVPLVIAREMPSELGVKVRDAINSAILKETQSTSIDNVISKNTKAIVEEKLMTQFRGALKAVAATLAIGATVYGLHSMNQTFKENEKREALANLPELEILADRILALPPDQQSERTREIFRSSPGDQYSSGRPSSKQNSIIHGLKSNQESNQMTALRVAGKLVPIDLRTKHGFLFSGGPDTYTHVIVENVWETALNGVTPEVRSLACKTGSDLLAAGKLHHNLTSDCEPILKNISINGKEPEVRQSASRALDLYFD